MPQETVATRHLLESTREHTTASSLHFGVISLLLPCLIAICGFIFCAVPIFCLSFTLHDRPNIPLQRLSQVRCILRCSSLGSYTRDAELVFKILHKPLPSSLYAELIFFGVQSVRFIAHRLLLGVMIERLIVFALRREEALALESIAYRMYLSNKEKVLQRSMFFNYGCYFAIQAATHVLSTSLVNFPHVEV